MLNKLIFPLLLFFSLPSFAAEILFEGTPEMKVQVIDGAAQTETVQPQKAREFRVVVARVGDQFYWASRNEVPLIKRESGAYVTYVAANGAGYVRVLIPAMRKLINSTKKNQHTREFVYMEHIVNQMGSITYYGK